nr:ribonuclease H-like domain, reverse transcriptase, RNA-dependent DNA polymerase [Tanacetum cinerariifolium]
MSAKRTAWNDFSSSMASAVICLATGRKFNFSKYIFDSLVRNVDSSSKFYMYPRFLQLMIHSQVGDLSSHTTKYSSPVLTQKQAVANVDDVVADSVPTDDVADDVPAAVVEPTPPSPPPTTTPPPPQELPSTSHRGIIELIDADKDVTLLEIDVEENVKVAKNADIQGRQEESQAHADHTDLEHADKVLSMHDDEPEPTELQKLIEVVTTA